MTREEHGEPRLTIRTPDGTVGLSDRWLAFIERELCESDRFLIVDGGAVGIYAQAFNHHGTLLLEYRDGSPQRRYQVTGVGRAEVPDALAQWSRGERASTHDHGWKRLRDWTSRPVANRAPSRE